MNVGISFPGAQAGSYEALAWPIEPEVNRIVGTGRALIVKTAKPPDTSPSSVPSGMPPHVLIDA